MKTNFHNKNFALRLALKMRQARTRKWAIELSFVFQEIQVVVEFAQYIALIVHDIVLVS